MTTSPTRAMPSRSLAMRLRGWWSHEGLAEQRHKHLATLKTSVKRRWWLIGIGAALLLGGRWLGLVAGSWDTIGMVIALAALVNVGVGAPLRRGWYRWWQLYGFALLDIALVGGLIAFYGPGGLVAGLLVALMPYTFDQPRGAGTVLIVTGSVAYLGAAGLHQAAFEGTGFFPLPAVVYLEAGVFILVAWTITRTAAALIERLRITRDVVTRVERGSLGVRAPAAAADELGLLERSLNRMLDEIARTITAVLHAADEVATFAEQLAGATEQVLSSSSHVAETATALASSLSEQRQAAQVSQDRSTQAARQAGGLRSRAELTEADTRRLVEQAARGRERVGRASETLLTIGREVHSTAQTVQELSALSERIGVFNQTIAKIARQTHLLALNAAIEAARAEEHGAGFAAVAEQVHALAGETTRSARDVAELIAAVRSGIDAVAHAMASGEERVHDVGSIANEAREALDEIHAGVLKAVELVTATAEISRTQAEGMSALSQQLSRMAETSGRSSDRADGAAGAMRSQIAAMDRLARTGRELSALASRLRAVVARYSIDGERTSPGRGVAPT